MIRALRPLLCTYRLNWARRISRGWWDDTALQTQDSKFEPWRSEAELLLGHGSSPQYWVLGVDGEETFFFFQTAETGKRTPNSSVKGSGANHYPRAPKLLRNNMFLPRSASGRQGSNTVSGEQCHLIHRTMLGRLSWPSLAVHKGGLKPYSFHFDTWIYHSRQFVKNSQTFLLIKVLLFAQNIQTIMNSETCIPRTT